MMILVTILVIALQAVKMNSCVYMCISIILCDTTVLPVRMDNLYVVPVFVHLICMCVCVCQLFIQIQFISFSYCISVPF